jgi:hypothetical protein
MKQQYCEWIFINYIPHWFTRWPLLNRVYMWFAINGYGDTGEDVDFSKDYGEVPF